ncbi:MAG: amino acid adenylation protein [Rhodospirillales bacterium]|nr:amino acid adenylation protein [Rhodospirillales bacterium]
MDQEPMHKDTGPDRPLLSPSVTSVFAEIARLQGDRIALIHDDGNFSYRELDIASDRIAGHLAAQLIGPGAFVGLCAETSAACIAAILGILKVGAAYIPFDPSYPPRLLDFVRQDSAPAMMLYSRRQRHLMAPTDRGLVIEDLLEQASAGRFVGEANAPDQIAYLMYTSGSTGRPKGVIVPHRAIVRLVQGADYARLDADEVILQQAPLSFDASTFEIWGALLNGGVLAIPPGGRASLDDIAGAIARFKVTTLWLTAGLFHLMVDHRLEALRPLRQLLAGGDVLSAAHVRKLRAALPSVCLINGYGPTENTTFSCCYTVEAEPGDTIPIGTAINGTSVHILDEDGRPVADGDSGELHVGGLGLAHGYLNRPELTAEKFVPNPFADQPGERLYRTGDRVRRRADGNLEFLGRADRQVKINGKRVELDEIEATVRRSDLVGDAATAVVDGANGARMIALFVTPRDASVGTVDALRRFIIAELPDYMMPGRIELMRELPLSPTGKLDRIKLVEGLAKPAGPAGPAPIGHIPQTVRAAWRQALATDAFGMDDNFFDLGGTSLQLVGMHAGLQSALGRSLPLLEFFDHPTVRSLATWLEGGPASAPISTVQQDLAAKRNAALARTRLARGMDLP